MNIPLEMAGVISGNVTDEGDEAMEASRSRQCGCGISPAVVKMW